MVEITNENLITRINNKIKNDFGITITLEGLDEIRDEFNFVLDYQIDELKELNKSCLLWITYLTDLNGILFFYSDQYKNVRDIYEYLVSISVKATDEFIAVAPKYKIDVTDIPYAIKFLEDKIENLSQTIKDFKIMMSNIESYKKFMIANYYRSLKLIQQSTKREWNVSF
jgi:hypothetical protein